MSEHLKIWIAIYLAGSVCVIFLTLGKIVLAWLLTWLLGDRVYWKNANKLSPVDERSLWKKIAEFLGLLLIESLLSWINVAVVLWQIVKMLLGTIRNLLSPKPDLVRQLVFPLRVNPNLSQETVWAHLFAVQILTLGRQPTVEEIQSSIEEVLEEHPSFDAVEAVKELGDLKIIKSDVMDNSLAEAMTRRAVHESSSV
jgi:hypothetical protein